MSLKGGSAECTKWSWEKCVCVWERAGEIHVGVTQHGFPRAFTPVCWCILFFFPPVGSLMESVVKNKTKKASGSRGQVLGRGAGLDCRELWEESHWSCCEGICELQGELPCWVAPCEGQCAVYSGTGPSGISYRPQPRCSQIELFVLCACAVFPHVLWAKAGKGRGAWPGLPCRHEWMKINKVHLRAEWIITTQAAA